jgi:hypothetical protein
MDLKHSLEKIIGSVMNPEKTKAAEDSEEKNVIAE